MARQTNELFDKQKIKKYSEEIEITDTQKNAAKEWLDLLDKNKLEKEDQNRSFFENIILQRILGYSVYDYTPEKDNIDYTITNREAGKSLCIEVKGTSTKDLFAYQNRGKKDQENPIKQTWVYMGLGYDYGLCTNYDDFILLSRNVGLQKIHKFNFKSLKGLSNSINEDKLKEFVAIFSKKGIFDQDIITKLTNESALAEQEFTDEFYKLYHETRLMLIREFSSLQEVTTYEAIHWAQIYLNRLIFIFFIEDHNFIPVKVFQKRIMDVIKSSSISEYTKLVSENLKDLFKIMNNGSKIHGINGFNGGLFEKEIPVKIYFNDLRDSEFFKNEKQNSKLSKKSQAVDLGIGLSSTYAESLNPIIKNLLIMDSFDFTSDLNVNILGHIFEQSLTDLEELRKPTEQEAIKKDSKRKKEGIYYTPEFITDFICRNTIIPYFSKSRVNTVSELIDEYSENITELERKIKDVKIVDPSCGSGAFLIKAVDILLEINEELEKIKSYAAWGPTQLKNWSQEREIERVIEANIYGVDINEESVEITQLALFLKLAAPNRKLISLSKNIKIGNSLIDDKSIDQKAFDWKNEFPEVMHEKYGGFDIIIGNPPYVRVQELKYEHIDYFKSHYDVAYKRVDISMLFFELAKKIANGKGRIGFIASSQFMTAEYGRNLRKLLLGQHIEKFVDFGSLPVFEDAITYPVITIFSIGEPQQFFYYKLTKLENSFINNLNMSLETDTEFIIKVKVDPTKLDEEVWNFSVTELSNIISKIRSGKNKVALGDFANPSTGITTGLDEVLIVNEDRIKKYNLENKLLIKILRGRNIDPWSIRGPFDFAIYPYRVVGSDTELITFDDLKNSYPNVYNYLLEHKKELLNRKDSRKTVGENKEWFELIRRGKMDIFQSKKIVTPALTKRNSFALDKDGSAFLTGGAGVFAFVQNDFNNSYLLAILNSKLIEFFLHSISTKKQGGYYSYLNAFLSQIPIIKLDPIQQKPFIEKVTQIEFNIIEILKHISKFKNRLLESFPNVLISKKLARFYDLEFSQCLDEIYKTSKIKLGLKETDEWEDYFDTYKNKITLLNKELDQIVVALDKLIFELYGLTEEEQKKVLQWLESEKSPID